jgi:hypothetical protein
MDLGQAEAALAEAEKELAAAQLKRDQAEKVWRTELAKDEACRKERAAMAERSPEAFERRKARVRKLMAPLEQLRATVQREIRKLDADRAKADGFHARDIESDIRSKRRVLDQIEHGVQQYSAAEDDRLHAIHEKLDPLAYRGRPSLSKFRRMLADIEDEESELRERHPDEGPAEAEAEAEAEAAT